MQRRTIVGTLATPRSPSHLNSPSNPRGSTQLTRKTFRASTMKKASIIGKNKKTSLISKTTDSSSLEQFLHFSKEELINLAITILKKSSFVRSEMDIDRLMICTSSIKFFENLSSTDPKIHSECCRYLSYSFLPKDSILFSEGDEGDAFYIILKGKVGILKEFVKVVDHPSHFNGNPNGNPLSGNNSLSQNPLAKDDSSNSLHNKPNQENSFQNSSSNNSPLTWSPRKTLQTQDSVIQSPLSPSKHHQSQNSKGKTFFPVKVNLSLKTNYGSGPNFKEIQPNLVKETIEVKVLEDGDSFGELALMNEKKRSATIVAKSDCHLAVLRKNEFNSTLS